MSELLPCPFCGGEAEKLTSIDGFTSIGCLNCNPFYGVMIQRNTEAEAIAAWDNLAQGNWKHMHQTEAERAMTADEWLEAFRDDVFYCSDRWSLDRLTRCHWMWRQYKWKVVG